MTAERIDPSEWPATISVGPGWYGLRIDTDHGTAVEYVDARALTSAREQLRNGAGFTAGPAGAEGLRKDNVRAHAGARCEEAA